MSGMDIETIKAQIDSEIQDLDSPQKLEDFRVRFLGRKGILARLTALIPALPVPERAAFGQQANALKQRILSIIDEKQKGMSGGPVQCRDRLCDISMPGIAQELGRLHPITQVTDEICAIFSRMGFSVVEGPEIETEYNNFTGLNIPL